MLFRIVGDRLEEIAKNEILERDVQRLVEANLALLFGLVLVESEYAIENVRFDTLAFDKDDNAPVIIEFKKTFEKSVFDQGLEYLNILFSRKADFTLRLHKKLGISAEIDSISWENSRVIFVGNRFSERQKRAVSFVGLPIELWTFEWFENNSFRMEQETLTKEAGLDFAKSALGETSRIEKVQREIKEYSRDYYRENSDPKIWELFEKLENMVKDLGEFEIIPRKTYIAIRGKSSSFCVVKLLKSKLQVEFGKKKDVETFNSNQQIYDISKKEWNHALMYEVATESDLDELMLVLKRAYELM